MINNANIIRSIFLSFFYALFIIYMDKLQRRNMPLRYLMLFLTYNMASLHFLKI